MFLNNARAILTAGILAMVAALPVVRAEEAQNCGSDCGNGGDACGQQFRTVCETVQVPEWYTEHVKCWSTKRVCENYTAYRCEKFPVQKTRTVTTYKKVPTWHTVNKSYCVSVPCTKQVTVMEKHWTCKTYTTYRSKWIDKGHWECREVPCGPSFFSRIGGIFRKRGGCGNSCDSGCGDSCGNDCGDSCGGCNDCCEAPRTRTKKVWVPCKVCIQVPCTKTKRVLECRPVCKTITTCRKEIRHKCVKVCSYKCVPCTKQVCYTEYCTKRVPYQATRWVCKRVCHTKAVRKCRMVSRTVHKQVPVCNTGCDNGCNSGCDNGCNTGCGGCN